MEIPSNRATRVETRGAGRATTDAKKVERAVKNIPNQVYAALGVKGAGKAQGDAKKTEKAIRALPGQIYSALGIRGDVEARGKAKKTEKAIDDLPKQKNAALGVTGTEVAISKARNLKGAIDNLSSKTITVTTHYRTVGKPGGGGEGKAGGGLITGPGTGTSDSIPLMGSNGEFMVRTAAVNYYGVDMLNAINQMRYAQGGLVTPTGPPPVASARAGGGNDVLLAELRGLRADVRRSARESGAEFGQRMNGILDDASRSTL